MNKFINTLKQLFNNSEIIPEVALACFNKLPDKIEVSWFRDGEYIVGYVDSDGIKFMTQAKNADEFIQMVNDSLFAVYEIPKKYFKFLESKKFNPTKEQYQALNNASIKKSNSQFKKEFAVV